MTYLNPDTIPVVSADSADNIYIQDVVGNKTDTHAGNSIYAKAHTIEEHFHKACKVYPTMADGVVVSNASQTAWVLGNFAEIVPVNTITSPFDIHFIGVEAVAANDVFELVLYKGLSASEIEIGRVRIAKNTNQEGTENQPFQTAIIAANERISAKVASAGGDTLGVTISIFYHLY